MRLLDAAEELILDYGFGGTTVDAVIERAQLTKGAFFHHFDSKADLGRALIERYASLDRELLETTMERAERLGRKPLEQVQIFLGLLEERMEDDQPHPGCLFASYCYQNQLFDAQTLAVGEHSFRLWRERLAQKFREAGKDHPRLAELDPVDLADMLLATLEGGFILSRIYAQPDAIARQLNHYRNYLDLLAEPVASPA